VHYCVLMCVILLHVCDGLLTFVCASDVVDNAFFGGFCMRMLMCALIRCLLCCVCSVSVLLM